MSAASYANRRAHALGMSARHVGVLFATCVLHASAVYFAASQTVAGRDASWSPLQVTFIPIENPLAPPPPPLVPVLLNDAFAERELMEIPSPRIELAAPLQANLAIHVPPPDPPPQPDFAPSEGQGFGPLTRPRVVSGPSSQDRYPRASIRHRESGRTVVKICISSAGAVDSVEVAESSGHARLDGAAVDIGWDYIFEPALRDGKPIAVCLPYGIRFRIGIGGSRPTWSARR